MKILSVVVPVYYNEQSLPYLFDKLITLEEQLKLKEIGLELIFVDDGSKDNSVSELKKIKGQRAATKIICLTRNFGAIHASKSGLNHVTGDCFMILAADLQDPPELILEMIDKWLSGTKFVIGIRRDRKDPAMTKFFAACYYRMLRFFVFKDYPHKGFDLALMDKTILPYLQNSAKNINTPLFAYWLGFKPAVIEYQRLPRLYGKSRWTFSKKVKFFLDSLLGFSFIPIRFIMVIGLAVSALSFIYGAFIFINALLGHIKVSGYAGIVVLITFLLGLIIIILGIIGEYVWRIYDESNKRPESVIEEIL
jgi:polyisoprenyl-phosphate glycosyltransferase